MTLAQGTVEATSISDGWLQAVAALKATSGRSLFHLAVRFQRPDQEDPAIRAAVDDLLTTVGRPSVATVRNTIFPAALAETSPDAQHLAERYRQLFPVIKKLHHQNRRGTYFGRLVAHPDGGEDQLNKVIAKLRRAVAGQRFTSIYEIDLYTEVAGDVSMSTYSDGNDRNLTIMGFPCLSYLSFHMDGDQLHLTAFYRNHYLIGRGYGNYLGLGQLLTYVAGQAGLRPGELLVVSGHAELDASWRRISPHLSPLLSTT